MKIKGKEININKKILIVVGIIVLVGIGFIGKGNNEEKRIIENSIKAIEDGDYDYARTALGSVVDGNNKKVDKLWNIVTCYQSASEQLYSYNNIEKAKEYLDKMNNDYKKYNKLKADVDKVREEIKAREDYIKEFDEVLKEAENLALSGKDRDTLNKARDMINPDALKYYSELPYRQQEKIEVIKRIINDRFNIIINEEKAKEDALREENNKKAEEFLGQQGIEMEKKSEQEVRNEEAENKNQSITSEEAIKKIKGLNDLSEVRNLNLSFIPNDYKPFDLQGYGFQVGINGDLKFETIGYYFVSSIGKTFKQIYTGEYEPVN
jgi:hypothetical protein